MRACRLIKGSKRKMECYLFGPDLFRAYFVPVLRDERTEVVFVCEFVEETFSIILAVPMSSFKYHLENTKQKKRK